MSKYKVLQSGICTKNPEHGCTGYDHSPIVMSQFDTRADALQFLERYETIVREVVVGRFDVVEYTVESIGVIAMTKFPERNKWHMLGGE